MWVCGMVWQNAMKKRVKEPAFVWERVELKLLLIPRSRWVSFAITIKITLTDTVSLISLQDRMIISVVRFSTYLFFLFILYTAPETVTIGSNVKSAQKSRGWHLSWLWLTRGRVGEGRKEERSGRSIARGGRSERCKRLRWVHSSGIVTVVEP